MAVSRRQFVEGVAALAFLRPWGTLAADQAAFYETSDGRAADFLVCRRLYLDICGRIPRRTEVERFIADSSRDKTAKLVDALLASEEFADYWSMRYCDCLRVKSEFPINLWPNAVYVYHRRIRAAIANDESWDGFARAMLAGRGSNFRVPEANFLRAASRKDPKGLSLAVSAVFLLKPSERYARYFERVFYKSTREWKEEVVCLRAGKGPAPEDFMTELEGALKGEFHSAPVKRLHWWLYGRLPDAARQQEWVTAFERGGLRMKPLIRYALSRPEYLAGPIRGAFPARRLDAEVLDDAICGLLGMERKFQSIAPEPFTYLPPKRRSVLVEDGSISSAFLLLFGRPARDTGELTERNNEISPAQRQYLFASSRLWMALGKMAESPRLKKLKREEQIKQLYYDFLARPPQVAEMKVYQREKRLRIREIAWILLNSKEFLYRV